MAARKGGKGNSRKKNVNRRKPPVMEAGGEGKAWRGKEMPAYPSYRGKRKRSRFRSRLRWLKFGGGNGGMIYTAMRYGALVVLLLLMVVMITLPDIDELNTFKKTPSVLIKSENGDIVGSIGDIYGEYVTFKQFPTSLIDAVVATEDRNFYHHFGVDPLGLLRAMAVNVQAGHVVQGGSTITQQVAKNVFLTSERSFLRKLREMILAFKLEWRYSKKDIMSIYLNRVYLGAGSYGVDAASRRYFDKPAVEMNLSESAIMAGLLKAPSRYAPTSNPAQAKLRALVVLGNMQDAGYLTELQANKAKAELNKAMSGRKRQTQSAQYFADWVMDQLPDYIGDIQEDMEVVTTLYPNWQAAGDKAISDVMDKDSEALKASQAALVSMKVRVRPASAPSSTR